MPRPATTCAVMLALCCAIACRPASAQSLARLPDHARVRVFPVVGAAATGRIVEARRDSLWLRLDHADSVAAYATADLRSYAVSLGTPRRDGARRGAVIAGAVGLAAVALSLSADRSTGDAEFVPATLVVAPLAALFTLVGAGVGARMVQERWTLPEPLRVGVGAGARVGLAFRVSF